MENITYSETIDLLHKDVLKNIILLKHANMLKEKALYYHSDNFIAIQFSPALTHHDRSDFPLYKSISIVSNDHEKKITD